MHFYIAGLATIFAVVSMGPRPVNAITAYSGIACDGSAGLNVPCDGSCHSFDGRHSFVSQISHAFRLSQLDNSNFDVSIECRKRRPKLCHRICVAWLSCRG